MKINVVSLLLCIVLFSCQPKSQLPIIQPIDSDWVFKSKNGSTWLSATIPGNVFTDLLDHQLIDDPFIKTNEENVQWVSDSSCTYKTNFKVDKSVLQKKYITLNFKGLDTYSKVYLNDSLILSSNNAFREYSASVQSILEDENELILLFENTSFFEEREKKKLTYELPEGGRIFTRKAQFQYGWDWGPKLNTSGIWKDVYMKAWDDIRFSNVFTKLNSLTKEKAKLTNQLTIVSDKDQPVTIKTTINGASYDTSLLVKKGTDTYSFPLDIQNPKLWWPHNLGVPYLYDLSFDIIYNRSILDSKKIKYGVRTIELVSEKDSIGESFYFKVNDVPVYAKGANYIPQNSFQNKVTDQHYEKLLNDVVDANMNMLRVWGGGIYENDIFYDLCDEKGILVWQDFMFACAMYPGDNDFLENAKQEATQQVKRLRNHASIALWAGNNENSEGWHRWGWQSGRSETEKKEIWNNYLKVFDSILPKTVKEFSQTSYWESSPKYGRGNPKYKTEGDAHDWWVWHDGYPFEHFEENVPRFMSEFGFQSFPSYEAINYLNQKDSVDIDTDAIKSHQKHVRGFELMDTYMKRDYPVPNSDEDYVYVSQLVQAKGITMAIEAHRRAKPYNMGSLFWQLNDCWPAVSWSSIDYFGNWKALHYKAKRAFEDILVSTKMNQNNISVHLINDLPLYVKDSLRLKIIDFEGKELWFQEEPIYVTENSNQIVNKISLSELDIDLNKSVLITSSRTIKATYHYFKKPKELNLLKSKIDYDVKKVEGGFLIKLQAKFLQKDVFLTTKNEGHFSDNFFDLMPNTAEAIFFKTEAKSLDKLTIKSLNQITP